MTMESPQMTKHATKPNTDTADAAPDINNVTPFSEDDLPCLSEVRSVLEKHGKVGRFAIQLRHQHFDLGENEALLETVDDRTLTSRAVDLDEVVLGEGEGLMITAIDLLKEPNAESIGQTAGRPLCRYVYVDTPEGSKHQHVPIFD